MTDSLEPTDPTKASPTDGEALPGIDPLSETEYDGLSDSVKTLYDGLAKRMYMFPNSLLRELNELIDANTITTATKLKAVVKDRYKGTLKIPGDTTFRAYVVVRRKQKALLEKARQSLEETPLELQVNKPEGVGAKAKSVFQDLTLSVENKKGLLENLIHLCETRISAIQILQENDPTSSYEQVLGSYIREVRAITETLIKMRNELKSEGEKEIEAFVNSKLASVIRSTLQAYTSVHGTDKIELFRNTLKLKLKDNKLEELSSQS